MTDQAENPIRLTLKPVSLGKLRVNRLTVIRVLADPSYRSTQERAKALNISYSVLYQALQRDPTLVDEAQALAFTMVKAKLSDVYGVLFKAVERGSFKACSLLLKVSGLIQKNVNVNGELIVNSNSNTTLTIEEDGVRKLIKAHLGRSKQE